LPWKTGVPPADEIAVATTVASSLGTLANMPGASEAPYPAAAESSTGVGNYPHV
jgi:hypothetical protein